MSQPDLDETPEHTLEVSEDFAAALAEAGQQVESFTDAELYDLAELVLQFSQTMSGMALYPYQEAAALGIIFSILREDGEEITVLMARQIGKTEVLAVVVPGLMVLLPILAEHFSDDRIRKYKDGFWVGIFGPNTDTSSNMYQRMQTRLYTDSAREVLADPEVDVALPVRGKKVELGNGSRVDCNTAAAGAKIEGKTYHLVIIEECQHVGDQKIKKSIHPMCASTAGTLVKIGTPTPYKCEFEEACRRNKRRDLDYKGPRFPSIQYHYEYDYTVAVKYNARYAKYILREIERLGEDSDEFRMAYKLHWILERGRFITEGKLNDCGIAEKDVLTVTAMDPERKGQRVTYRFKRPDYPATNDRHSFAQVAGLDFGKSNNSTVLTVARVWWDNPIVLPMPDGGQQERFYVHVQNWLELQGDDHTAQLPQVVEFLLNYDVGLLVCDGTGPGDPLTDFYAAALEEHDIVVEPFIFSGPSKDAGYKLFLQELDAKRFTFPAGEGARKQRKVRRFIRQMEDLEKRWRGSRMVVQKPKGKNTHDDYPDSAMMLVWGVVSFAEGSMEAEVVYNPVIGRQARRDLAMFNNSGAGRRVRMKDKLDSPWDDHRPPAHGQRYPRG